MLRAILYFSLFLFFVGCNSTKKSVANKQNTNNQQLNVEDRVVFVLEKEPCRGFCKSYKATVFTEKVIFEGKRNVKLVGLNTASASRKQVKSWISEIEAVQFFEMKDSYLNKNIADIPKWHLTYNEKKITFFSDHAPKELKALFTKLETEILALEFTEIKGLKEK